MDLETVEYEVQDSVATVRLDRPDKLNAIDAQMRSDLDQVVEEIAVDDDVRAAMITGNGKAFSSGADHGLLQEMEDNSTPRFRWEYRRLHRVFDNIAQVEKPIVGAINGICVGGGLELALYTDMMVASERALFGFPEDNIGLIPASGACVRLAEEVGTFRAKELIMYATRKENMVSAEEAMNRFGFVNRVFDDDTFEEDARAFVGELAERSPLAMGLAKKVINHGQDMDFVTGRKFERTAQSVLIGSEDHQEGLAAFREKRDPEFEGR
ncbi:MAG: enoyl-CoA hydratase/isomerase family protein [Salinigranum sp.]